MTYKYLEDVSIADVAFEATGRTLEEMFESAGLAVTNTMVKNLKSVKPKIRKTIKAKGKDVEKLLFNFLQEFVYWKDKDLLLFSKIKVTVREPKTGGYSLVAVLSGDKINVERHEMLVDVKAVTWHLFSVKKEKKWTCRVVLDI
ncbi:MAG: archease [Candidatus Aenigmarchaeota archaeon]|nr:archease [Candidatus Aenigmarchaeota archaeon]